VNELEEDVERDVEVGQAELAAELRGWPAGSASSRERCAACPGSSPRALDAIERCAQSHRVGRNCPNGGRDVAGDRPH
jgi:hypothetical protein